MWVKLHLVQLPRENLVKKPILFYQYLNSVLSFNTFVISECTYNTSMHTHLKFCFGPQSQLSSFKCKLLYFVVVCLMMICYYCYPIPIMIGLILLITLKTTF